MVDENHYDCLIIGAGISGLDAAYHLQEHCQWASYAILERRANLGGTWDFFKYPGIRSDSDMYTFGFSWKLWKSAKPIAPAEDILAYLKEAAEEQGIMKNINFNTDISNAAWESADNMWHLTTASGKKYSCNVLFGCSGYYSYETPFEPTFPGQENFPGTIVHPQKWTAEHDELVVGAKVALIGSGATAVTILPNISDSASHVTLIQRTPTYIAGKPETDPFAQFCNTWLPQSIAVKINRWKAVLLGALFYQFCVRYPERAKKLVKAGMYKEVQSVMSEEEFDKHFSPPYNPWQQRFCLAPGGDFFAPIRDGKASIVTGHIQTFTEKGIKMKSGEHIDADMIISATGLTMQQNFPFSTIKVTVDGALYKAADHLMYNAMMVSDVPNFAFIVGYTNASWTLKADIAALYFTKLLNHMRSNKIAKVVPREDPEGEVKREFFSGGLTSGYFARSGAVMPKQGDKFPWQGGVNYILDLIQITFGGISKDCLHFEVDEKKNL
eukprot:TRINITY_DN11755_c0_g1_i1.p1 TRINITY_DN11755_c0_g1~~TRINITY_DN11755_c0_g1_i1.p1  ORF type:complete len:497 (-),score=148.91 TRINITY_DN11755_c0_g1_i1:98-1588(-)